MAGAADSPLLPLHALPVKAGSGYGYARLVAGGGEDWFLSPGQDEVEGIIQDVDWRKPQFLKYLYNHLSVGRLVASNHEMNAAYINRIRFL